MSDGAEPLPAAAADWETWAHCVYGDVSTNWPYDTAARLDDCLPRSAAIHRSPTDCYCAGGTDSGRLLTQTEADELHLRCMWQLGGSRGELLKFVQPNV